MIVYCLAGIAIYYSQDYILFAPVAISRDEPFGFHLPFREVNIPYSNGSSISVVQFTNDSGRSRGVVLYFHGNKANISRYTRFVPAFTRNGYEVWMIDYPGYGKSTGTFTEQVLYDWSLQLYKLARARYTPDSIIIYGKSMGTGIAAQLASVRDSRRLILETPYYTLPSVIGSYLPMYPLENMIRYRLPTWQYLQKVTAPVTIFHGTADWIIPYSNASRLKPFLKPNDQFVTIEGGHHRDLGTFPAFSHTLDSLLTK